MEIWLTENLLISNNHIVVNKPSDAYLLGLLIRRNHMIIKYKYILLKIPNFYVIYSFSYTKKSYPGDSFLGITILFSGINYLRLCDNSN